MMLAILSLGAIYAIIPLIIILILILAARGLHSGTDLFAFFGIDTLIGFARGYSGKGLAGKGNRYPAQPGKGGPSPSTKRLAGAAGGLGALALGKAGKGLGIKPSGSTIANLKNQQRALRQSNEDRLGKLSNDQLVATAKHFGLGQIADTGSNEALMLFITGATGANQLKKYLDLNFNRSAAESGTTVPLPPPTVRMSWGEALRNYPKDFANWQSNFRAETKTARRPGSRNKTLGEKIKILNNLKPSQIAELCKMYGLKPAADLNKEEVITFISARLNYTEINNYLKRSRPSTPA